MICLCERVDLVDDGVALRECGPSELWSTRTRHADPPKLLVVREIVWAASRYSRCLRIFVSVRDSMRSDFIVLSSVNDRSLCLARDPKGVSSSVSKDSSQTTETQNIADKVVSGDVTSLGTFE